MKQLALAVLVATLTAWAGVATVVAIQPPTKVSPETSELVKGNTAFALDLYNKLSSKEGNLFFSPYSISTALAMTYGGARGETADEMAKTLHFSQGQENLHRAFAGLIDGINGKNGPRSYELTTANRLWGQKDYIFDPNFIKLTQDNYGAGLKEVDFAKATEEARQTINEWVEEQTKQKIKDLLKTGMLTPAIRLVLTNAIYFKASWAEPFSPKATKPGEFKLSAAKSVADVPMMQRAFTYGIKTYEDDAVQVLALPYAKDELSMVVVLPRDVDGLPRFEKKLVETPAHLGNLLARLAPGRAKVTLPKFKVTSEFELTRQLQALGMKTAFINGKADFSGIATRDPLSIGFVVHKAFVDVHETGTEAAAATAVGLKAGGKPQQPPEFRADHPFLYLIMDNNSGSILFMGRLVNPKG